MAATNNNDGQNDRIFESTVLADPQVGDHHDAFFDACAGQSSIAVLPLGPRIIVEKIKETGITEGGIVVHEHRADPRKREITLSRGRVVSVGVLEKLVIEVGMFVIYADQTAIQLKIGGITYGDVLYEDDIIAIIGE